MMASLGNDCVRPWAELEIKKKYREQVNLFTVFLLFPLFLRHRVIPLASEPAYIHTNALRSVIKLSKLNFATLT